ncbi:MAG: (d)CMP kinase [Caldilineaceae bacterium]
MRPAIIAIDGPAGAGKSTIGHDLAAVLNFLFDTGIMYRAVTWAALERQFAPDDGLLIGKMTEQIQIHVTPVADHEHELLAVGTYCYGSY